MTASARQRDLTRFSEPVARYLAEHAIDAHLAAELGVTGIGGELVYPYLAPDGQRFERRRPLGPGKTRTFQPDGVALCLWWPENRPHRAGLEVLVCEGEPDALAALSALRVGPEADGHLNVCAIPGTGMGAEKVLAELATYAPSVVYLCCDADVAGRTLAEKALALAGEYRVDIVDIELSNGDLADWLVSYPPHERPLRLQSLLLDFAAVAEERARDAQRTRGPLEQRTTESSNADRFVQINSARLRYMEGSGTWMRWRLGRWQRESELGITDMAREVVQQLFTEAAMTIDERERKALLKWASRTDSVRGLANMIKLARLELRVDEGDFDADPNLLGVLNGVVDLSTGQLIDADPELLISQMANVVYEPDRSNRRWEEFVYEACGGDERYVDYLQRAVGYSLTGHTDEEKLFYLHGRAGSGKSTLLGAIEAAMGSYAVSADIDTLLPQQSGGPRPDLTRLRSSRMVAISETPPNAQMASHLLKRLTGGDAIVARRLYREHEQFTPRLKLWMASNYPPRVDAADSGTFRRLVVLPFSSVPATPRPQLKRDLTNPDLGGAAILAWAVEGALQWRARRLDVDVPDVVRNAGEQLHFRSDPVGWWLKHTPNIRLDATATTGASKLYGAFAAVTGPMPLSQKAFSQRLIAEGYTQRRKNDGVHYIGIALT